MKPPLEWRLGGSPHPPTMPIEPAQAARSSCAQLKSCRGKKHAENLPPEGNDAVVRPAKAARQKRSFFRAIPGVSWCNVSMKTKRSWQEKLADDKGLPKVAPVCGDMTKRWGSGVM